MIMLWITLLFLHQAYSQLPVKTVQLGEPVTFECALHSEELTGNLQWYKQSVGDSLNLIVTLYKGTTPQYDQEIFRSRFVSHIHKTFSSLTILKTVQEDEGIYHCGIIDWTNVEWNATYLLVKGNTNYNVVQLPTVLDPLHPGESVTLQCSVLSDSQNKACSGDQNVFWFRVGLHKSLPNIIYTGGNRSDECEKRSKTRQSCVYRFSKNVSSLDAGIYYCAVATCGEILFGNGTDLELVQTTQLVFILPVLMVCLAISVIGNVFLICNQRRCKPFKATESIISDAQTDTSHQPTEANNELNYVALTFSERKTRGRMKREFAEDSVYSPVNC